MGFGDGSGISWTICKQSAPRSRQITTLIVLQAVCSSWCPTNSVKALKAISKVNCYLFYFRQKHAYWQLCFILDQLLFWDISFFRVALKLLVGRQEVVYWCNWHRFSFEQSSDRHPTCCGFWCVHSSSSSALRSAAGLCLDHTTSRFVTYTHTHTPL